MFFGYNISRTLNQACFIYLFAYLLTYLTTNKQFWIFYKIAVGGFSYTNVKNMELPECLDTLSAASLL